LRILDPACGSGSFLLGAYTFLLDYHRDWYLAHDPKKHTDKIYQGRAGHYFLTIKEKKRILLNNIFGVDIDPQAVEVTKLALLLKVLEGENAETIGQVYKMFHERALPDLADNIKCGNSLIGPDFFDDIERWQPQADNIEGWQPQAKSLWDALRCLGMVSSPIRTTQYPRPNTRIIKEHRRNHARSRPTRAPEGRES
jgi:hypothetical protein